MASSRTASLSAGLASVHLQGAIIAATRRPACPPETPFGWQGAALALRKRSPRKSGPTAPQHRIIARLYNVGVGGILAQHLAKCCPCRPLQARLAALCEPCGTPPVALAGCGLHRRPARCTSHGPRLDRRAAPHRDRHSPVAPLRSGGPQAATPATPRPLRVSCRPLFRARCASGQPSPVPRSRLRQAPPSPRCPSWPALSRNPGHPPLRARFPQRLASHFSPRWRRAAPRRSGNSILHESKPKALKISLKSSEIMLNRVVCLILFLWSQYFQPSKPPARSRTEHQRWTAKKHQNPNP